MPTNTQDVSYITQENGKATLWEMGKDGSNARVVTSFDLLPLAQHLSWSPDGRYLAVQVMPGATPSCALLQDKSHALLLDTRSNTVSTLVSPGEITVDELHWSPDSKFLTCEQVSTQGKASLHTPTRQRRCLCLFCWEQGW